MEQAGHNNIERYAKDYLTRVRCFLDCVSNWVEEKNQRLKDEEAAADNQNCDIENLSYGK